MVGPARFERATLCLEGRCSIQLSYGPVKSILAVRSREKHLIADWPWLCSPELQGAWITFLKHSFGRQIF